MTEDLHTDQVQPAGATARAVPETKDANAIDLANRLRGIVAELETGIPTEPDDLLSPSEKLRALADLIDRRAATAVSLTASGGSNSPSTPRT